VNVIVVGAGKVGYYLAKTLVESGHLVALVDKNPESCRWPPSISQLS